jgi:excisionase family DNA binding protein
MGSLASWPANTDGDALTPDVLEAVVRVVMVTLAARPSPAAAQNADPSPMLTVQQTAVLMGMSRMTVIRKADAGELPCVVVSRGGRQKMRRFPRAPIEELAARGGTSPHLDLGEYTARWLASTAAQVGQTGA